MKAYLLLYNISACVGWAYLLFCLVQGLREDKPILEIWQSIGMPLMLVQSAAALEILHAALGLVSSPLSSTFFQVASRLIMIWAYTYWAPACHKHWSLILMVGSWAAVEVPRYLFYALNILPAFAGKNMPNILFALRYSLFLVLYPSGISGEILQVIQALPFIGKVNPMYERLAHVHLALYLPLGPYMIMNMWHMRNRAYKKRALELQGSAKEVGLSWPVTDPNTGERSTTVTNRSIWEESVKPVDSKLAEQISRVRNWRFGYVKHVELNARCCLESRENALKIASSGLKYAVDQFVFIREDKSIPFSQAMKSITDTFETGYIKGSGIVPKSGFKLKIPYKDQFLEGDAARIQLDKWVDAGTIEPSAGDAIKMCIQHPEWMNLSDRYFVLLGASSAMGPLNALLSLGANIIAVDIDRPMVWKGLIEKARASCGSLYFPLRKPQKEITSDEELFSSAGANLLEKTPEIANWLCSLKIDNPLTIGNYTYLDGALHVQLALACDCIIERLCEAKKDTSVAFLCTPTDVHAIPKEAHDAALDNYKNAPAWQKYLEVLIGGKTHLAKNALPPVSKSGLYLVDGIVSAQGPNYALAKRLQHWRAVLAHSKGHTVSSNVAPSTATKSVVSNAQFAAAYSGFFLFKSMEVMYQDTSSAVMLALLVNDLRNPKSAANPANHLDNPFQLFEYNSFHGGVWRCPYKVGSIGVIAALYYYLTTYSVVLFGTLAAMFGTINYVVKGSAI